MFKKSVFFVVFLVFVSSCFSSDKISVPKVKEFYNCGVLSSFDSREGLFNYTNCFVEKFNSCSPVKFSKSLNNSVVDISVFGRDDNDDCLVKVFAKSDGLNKSVTCPVGSDFGSLGFGTDSVLGVTNLVFYVSQRSEVNSSSCMIE